MRSYIVYLRVAASVTIQSVPFCSSIKKLFFYVVVAVTALWWAFPLAFSIMEREARLAQMFGEEEVIIPTNDSQSDYFDKMEKLLSQETRVWWDYNTLKGYVAKNMIPRGLRIKKLPTLIYSDAFLIDWNNTLSECSLSLMRLIIDQEALKLQELSKEMTDLKNTVSDLATDKPFMDQNEKLMATINKLEATIMQVKKNKYQRDMSDYQKNEVYLWRRNENGRTPRSILRQNNRKGSNYSVRRKVGFSDADTDSANSDCDSRTGARPKTGGSGKGNQPNNQAGSTASSHPAPPFLESGGEEESIRRTRKKFYYQKKK